MAKTKKASGLTGSIQKMTTAMNVKTATGAKKSATKKPVVTVQQKSALKKTTPTPPKKATVKSKATAPAKKSVTRSPSKKVPDYTPKRYKCRICGYVYSPLRGEPHNGIPAGTEFEDLPDDYVCPVCGYQGKGRIGTWGFDEWRPTKYVCSICGYVYDEKRGEPHRGIKPGTKFEDLPENYVCPVCALDSKINVQFGKVLKQGFEPLNIS